MEQFNLMVAGFCFAASIMSFLAGDYIWFGVNLFLAIWNYYMGRDAGE